MAFYKKNRENEPAGGWQKLLVGAVLEIKAQSLPGCDKKEFLRIVQHHRKAVSVHSVVENFALSLGQQQKNGFLVSCLH